MHADNANTLYQVLGTSQLGSTAECAEPGLCNRIACAILYIALWISHPGSWARKISIFACSMSHRWPCTFYVRTFSGCTCHCAVAPHVVHSFSWDILPWGKVKEYCFRTFVQGKKISENSKSCIQKVRNARAFVFRCVRSMSSWDSWNSMHSNETWAEVLCIFSTIAVVIVCTT